MELSGSARSHRRSTPVINPKKHKQTSRLAYHFVLSCCIFFAVLCACLVTALYFLGKHYLDNHSGYKDNEATSKDLRNILTRLPEDVHPFHYDITLKPNLIAGDYKGVVNITLELKSLRSDVILHSKKLKLNQIDLYSDNKKIIVKNVEENLLDEMIIVSSNSSLVPGVYNLVIAFSGSLLNRTSGFYKSSYVKANSTEKRSIATSKFEPTYARQAFPCFDEPNMKAKYTVHLLKPADDKYIALSNMPEKSQKDLGEEGVLVTFEESVKMSTYLACFIVSDFTSSDDTINFEDQRIPFKVYATPAQLGKTEYALKTGKAIMEFYLQYFKIPYPLPKLDMVAIPDFVSGAMEHWGLVTYRETALLYDPSISSTANKQRVATVVAHELAHSWFGNLVTMNWWNDLWLNEGFASYIEYKGVAAAEPSWQMMDQFIIDDLHSVLKLDATLGSHPIVQTVVTPNQITEIFDTISYSKGASILRMLENAVGDKVFQKGVTAYLNKFAYGNAVTQNLLDELQILIGTDYDVTDFMNTWTVQMGYPIITVNKTGNIYKLTQKRFLTDSSKDGKDNTKTMYNYKWTIPVTYITSDNPEESKMIWFNHNQPSVQLEETAEWIKFNHEQVGYYRINYDDQEWDKLIDNIDKLSIANRAHLLEETFRIAEASQLSYAKPLGLTKYLENEVEYIPWTVAGTMLRQIKKYLTTSEYYNDFKDYVVKIVTPAYNTLTWKEDGGEENQHLKSRARVTVLDLACSMGHKDCLEEAKDRFTKWLAGEALSQDLRSLVYNYGMYAGSKEQWDQLWEIFVKEGDAGEKIRLLSGLTAVNDPTLLTRLIQLAKDETYIRNQDYFTCLSYISMNPIGTSIVWDYVRENWETLVDRFTINERYLGRLIPSITSSFATQTKLEEMKSFFAKYPNAGAGVAARAQALEHVENNIKWLKNNKKDVEDWIKKI